MMKKEIKIIFSLPAKVDLISIRPITVIELKQIGYNMFGGEQGILKHRFKVVRKRKPSPVQIINKELLRILKKRK